jgi:hypothetical protein
MPVNPLDLIVAQANAIKQQADALLLFVASLEPIPPQPGSSPEPTASPVPASATGTPQRIFRTFDDNGRSDVMRPRPDSSGDLRPTSTSDDHGHS